MKNWRSFTAVAGIVMLVACAGCSSEETQAMVMAHGEHGESAKMSADEHAAHMASMNKSRFTVSMQSYEVPDISVIDANGEVIALRDLLLADEPVALNFIFTTCATICPVMTATFAQVQRALGDKARDIRFVSISIDPEYDRPAVLKAYADQFQAGENWQFLTGDSKDIVTVMKSFDTYAGSKMNHPPVYFLKNPGNSDWVRVDGLASSASLAQEVTSRLLH